MQQIARIFTTSLTFLRRSPIYILFKGWWNTALCIVRLTVNQQWRALLQCCRRAVVVNNNHIGPTHICVYLPLIDSAGIFNKTDVEWMYSWSAFKWTKKQYAQARYDLAQTQNVWVGRGEANPLRQSQCRKKTRGNVCRYVDTMTYLIDRCLYIIEPSRKHPLKSSHPWHRGCVSDLQLLRPRMTQPRHLRQWPHISALAFPCFSNSVCTASTTVHSVAACDVTRSRETFYVLADRVATLYASVISKSINNIKK